MIGLLPVHNVAAQNTNNFSISSYDIQYELSRDSESRSVLKTTEKIVAAFPAYDQNHGLERAIPSTYENHSTNLTIKDVTDENGKSRNFTTYESNGNTVLRIGDPNVYVRGLQTYVITYTQRDVTRFFEDTGRDEWYWDTNGTEWQVPINALSISVKVDPSTAGAQVGNPVCYRGLNQSNTQAQDKLYNICEILKDKGGSYTVNATKLGIGENITVAFGFAKGTFAPYKMSPNEIMVAIWGVAQALATPVAVILIIAFSVSYSRRTYRSKETNPLVAEYIPPKKASLIVSSKVAAVVPQYVFSAQLIDLAVRHFISIIETKPRSTWKSPEYDLVITSDLEPLFEEEKEILRDMFDKLPAIGERLALKSLKNNTGYGTRILDNDKKLKLLIEGQYALREKVPKTSRLFYRWAIATGIFAVLTLSPALFFATVVIAVLGFIIRPLTDKGLALRRYVLGLNKYIKASETERLAFLQGPDTAQKVGYDVDPNNPGQLVKLYERVLPYAILFGQEKKWAKQLGDFYGQSQTTPDWYTGTSAFNAAAFASTMSSFSSASSYPAGSSSSSGGSSGGGFSGGGGGGGGGGGW